MALGVSSLASAADDDTVLVAGKGHENYQLIGDRRLDFSDVQTAGAALRVCRPWRARSRRLPKTLAASSQLR